MANKNSLSQMHGKKRIVIENVYPEIDSGKFPIKRAFGENITVRADVFTDGHNHVKAYLLYRPLNRGQWKKIPMHELGNDRFEVYFVPKGEGWYEYTLMGVIDYFTTWQIDLKKKFEANQDVSTELKIGLEQMKEAAGKLKGKFANPLNELIQKMEEEPVDASAVAVALSDELTYLMAQYDDEHTTIWYDKKLQLEVERQKALFSTWYELFPRSASMEPGKHGTFNDVIKLLPEIASMGFDVLYLPPIHPIGKSYRKGKNNSTTAEPGDPGSPWAIGSEEGGHKSIHPELGTLDDFKQLVEAARDHGLEMALDLAYQCSPDHPYVKEHPQWFKWRPDGTIQYAENPPKKYQDVLPLDFQTEDWENLWKELKSIVDYWIDQGVKIFRVDNPHTKPFVFWEWLISEVRKKHPEIIFLAEAFTRPRVMEQLAKIGFNQSYTYFTWRNTKDEFVEYITELTQTEKSEYYRPNFWPNTPDILPISLQDADQHSFIVRYVLAATLSSNTGIYGPAFELGMNDVHPEREEYNHNEKYEIKDWDWFKQTLIKEVIRIVNQARKDNQALQTTRNTYFADTENDSLLAYARANDEKSNVMIVAANMDPFHTQQAWIRVPIEKLNIDPHKVYRVHDLISGDSYYWQGEWNYVELNPQLMPVHLFEVSYKG